MRKVCATFLFLGVDEASISEAETQFALALLDKGVQETDILGVGEIPRRSQYLFSAPLPGLLP